MSSIENGRIIDFQAEKLRRRPRPEEFDEYTHLMKKNTGQAVQVEAIVRQKGEIEYIFIYTPAEQGKER